MVARRATSIGSLSRVTRKWLCLAAMGIALRLPTVLLAWRVRDSEVLQQLSTRILKLVESQSRCCRAVVKSRSMCKRGATYSMPCRTRAPCTRACFSPTATRTTEELASTTQGRGANIQPGRMPRLPSSRTAQSHRDTTAETGGAAAVVPRCCPDQGKDHDGSTAAPSH